ncbi:HIT-like domain-containing protein [Catenaria anguillulae PL171]|uniref:HIT-like domain-containing protein n=1 Tax=Catenaria anguillulae PL171 TaxID=765915 RepID=A0A1Y2HZP4_9FUNG|nr:HIT-like domain-containing protein [Catenaria anguillulae PL171]
MTTPATCIFCRIIRKEIPSFKLVETEHIYSFLDIGPLSQGHALVIPKHHGEKLHEIPDTQLAAILPAAKQIVDVLRKETGMTDYNILQNNGRAAHQEVPHVHFHIIPKRENGEGLGVKWVPSEANKDMAKLKELHERLAAQL